MNEKELIRGCTENNRQSQKAFYELFYGKIFGICLRYSNTDEDAHEMLQDGFVSVFKQLKHYKSSESLNDWVKKTCIASAIQYIRNDDKEKRMIVSTVHENKNVAPASGKKEKLSDEEIAKMVKHQSAIKALQQLTSGYRIVFNLHFIDDHSFEEIADILSVSEQTAKTNFEKSRFAFRNNLKQIIDKSSHAN